MNKTIDQLKLIFIGAFILMIALTAVVQVFYIIPMRRCEASGNWWAARYMRCAVPVDVQRFTGRPDHPFEPVNPAERSAK